MPCERRDHIGVSFSAAQPPAGPRGGSPNAPQGESLTETDLVLNYRGVDPLVRSARDPGLVKREIHHGL